MGLDERKETPNVVGGGVGVAGRNENIENLFLMLVNMFVPDSHILF